MNILILYLLLSEGHVEVSKQCKYKKKDVIVQPHYSALLVTTP